MIGRTLDRYRIESKLGEGGMGVVYKARDMELNRPVAIKVLPADRVADPERKRRFVREARAASALNHPNIVTVYDVRSDAGLEFLVMEYVEGSTLAERIPPGGMRPAEVLEYAVPIADSLARAHDAGILHRDVKPSNLMVTNDGRVKVLDFGLAKLTEPTASTPEAPTMSAGPLTGEATVVGTASYMSPEQAEGRKVDGRSDVFSFGAVLYEMLTGRRAFAGDSPLAILAKVLTEDPVPPGRIAPGTPPDLEKAVQRCLRKDPARRYQTMADLKVALEDIRSESVSMGQATTARAGARPMPRWIGGAVAVSLVLGVGFLAWRAARPPAARAQPSAVALTTFSGIERQPSLSPDGDEVAFTWNGPKRDNQDVYVQRIGSGSPLRLTTDPASEFNPAWSPDDRWIAFLRGNSAGPMSPARFDLVLVPPLGGPERRLAGIRAREVAWPAQAYLAWCPDATCLVVTDSPGADEPDALYVVSVETGEKRQLTHPRPPALGDSSPAVSPDGRAVVFRRSTSYSIGELLRLPVGDGMTAAGEPERVATAAFNADHPTWLPGGDEIVVSARGALWRLAVSGGRAPARLPFVGEDGMSPTISRRPKEQAPRLVYARSFVDDNIYRLDFPAPGAPAPAPPSVAISSSRGDVHARFSPDGRRVVFTSNRSGTWELWISDPDGGNAQRITSMDATNTGGPNWSPDGKSIVFGSDQPGQFDLYVVAASGGKPRRLTSHPAFEQGASFSHDGRWIYFTSNRTGAFQIWKMPADGGNAVQLTRNGGWWGAESPDGAHFYYIDIPMTPKPLWRVPAAGGSPERVVDGVLGWFFDVAATGLYYADRAPRADADRASGEARLRFYDFATRRSETVARLGDVGFAGKLGEIDFTPGISPDGRTVLYSRIDSTVDDLMLVENFR